MINVYEQIDRNKRRSLVVIIAFVVFIVAIGWIFSYLLELGPETLVLALILASFMSFASYWWGDKIVLATIQARPADRQRDFNFFTATENLSLAAQIPKPALYVIDDPSPNAFATGRDPQHGVVCATTGLIQKLDRTELEGVIAHEFSHIRGYDTRLMTIVGVLVGMVILASDWFMRGSFGRRGKDEHRGGGLLAIIGVLFIILSPIFAQLIQLAISRRREFLADAQAVMITRFPEGLARALEKISQDPAALKNASGATAHLFIVNPFKTSKASSFMGKLFSTHPLVEERIAALRQMS